MKRILTIQMILAAGILAGAQEVDRDRWFPPSDLMTVGAYYYPEAWPESQWERDIQGIRKLGMEFIHMGDFAWSRLEPEDGHFDFAWLDRNIELASRSGLKVVLCTPSAAPPVWLVRAHPEVLMVDSKGRQFNHGSRASADWSSAVYQSYVSRIVENMAKRYGNDARVWGWQIDNELSHYDAGYSYGQPSRDAFRIWLERRYGNIDNLNRSWGASFWSQTYQRFSQVDLPNPAELAEGVNPHALLDFERWFAVSAADYIRMQAAIIRKHSLSQWVTTNYMTLYAPTDPALSRSDLDVMSWTLYPVNGLPGQDKLAFRLGNPARMSIMHDMMRSLNPQFGLMELQPGTVNWGVTNPWPQPGAIRMWIFRAFASGARFVCTYRYRQPLYGFEQYHSGLVETDGVMVSPGGQEFSAAIRDLKTLRAARPPGAHLPEAVATRRTAMVLDRESWWDIDNHKQTDRWQTEEHWYKYYRALKRAGAPVDVVTTDTDLSSYPFAIVPAQQLADQSSVARWTAYAERGGHLLLTCRTAQKVQDGSFPELRLGGLLEGLIGARVVRADTLPSPHVGHVSAFGIEHEWASWGETLDPGPGTRVLVRYTDQFYRGGAAVVTRKAGKGTVTYAGVDTLDGKLEQSVVRGLFERAGVAIEDYPEGLFVDWRDGFWVATNFAGTRVTLAIPPAARLLVGKREIPSAGVTVWIQ